MNTLTEYITEKLKINKSVHCYDNDIINAIYSYISTKLNYKKDKDYTVTVEDNKIIIDFSGFLFSEKKTFELIGKYAIQRVTTLFNDINIKNTEVIFTNTEQKYIVTF